MPPKLRALSSDVNTRRAYVAAEHAARGPAPERTRNHPPGTKPTNLRRAPAPFWKYPPPAAFRRLGFRQRRHRAAARSPLHRPVRFWYAGTVRARPSRAAIGPLKRNHGHRVAPMSPAKMMKTVSEAIARGRDRPLLLQVKAALNQSRIVTSVASQFKKILRRKGTLRACRHQLRSSAEMLDSA